MLLGNSVWSYLDDGSDQGTGWREPGFDDSLLDLDGDGQNKIAESVAGTSEDVSVASDGDVRMWRAIVVLPAP